MTNKICVYAICKNESKFVDRWLASMKEADYLVVLDTGSDDNTFQLLKNDERVYSAEQKIITPWRFDTARNESMKLIPEDANILVCTDLDEVFEPGWAEVLRNNWVDGYHERATYKYAWSHTDEGEPGRIFYPDKIHDRNWCWRFPVHEMLVRSDGTDRAVNVLTLPDEVYLHHYADNTKSRGSYLPLLELRKQENPEDYYGKIYLAHEYYYRGHYTNAINELKEILEKWSDKYTTLEQASCYLFMGDAYRALGGYESCIDAYQRAILRDSTYREPYINLAEVLNELKFHHQAIGLVKECFDKSYRHYNWLERDTTWTYTPYDILSIAYYWVGEFDKALVNVHKALSYEPNNERILNNLKFIQNKCFEGIGEANG